jgi:translation initiation factor IF-1
MVKNTQGGKHKNQARKHLTAPTSSKLRLPEDDMECFAKVTAMSGNGMCRVEAVYQNEILPDVCCHIRGKFRGKNKRRNLVTRDSFILVGLRDWTTDLKDCDLLEVYPVESYSTLPIPASLCTNSSHDEDTLFSDNTTDHNTQYGGSNEEKSPLKQDTNIDYDLI